MAQNKILILFAHPLFEKSFVNQALVRHIPKSKNITFHDLYEEYPEFDIDVQREQALLQKHDIIIWHHPLYWYSCPPLLKQWIDMVFEYDWAYGKNGIALQNKLIFQAITTGEKKENYCEAGRDRYSIPELLEPFNQTAKVCNMHYLPPFVIHGTHQMNKSEADNYGKIYADLLLYLKSNELDIKEMNTHFYLNEWLNSKTQTNG
jgi:glutathione-regulated potassium-efflux system ancillary protein KefG